jgi:hypothetical protein
MGCAEASAVGVHGDESAVDPVALRHGLHYVSAHLSGLPAVEVVRLGRTFGFYHPVGQIDLDTFVEGRPRFWALVGLGMFYAFAPLSAAGALLLRRRKVPLFPMIAVAADVIVAVLVTYGQTRFRATLEPVLVLLSAVAVEASTRIASRAARSQLRRAALASAAWRIRRRNMSLSRRALMAATIWSPGSAR